MIGDTVGDPGQKAIERVVPGMKKRGEADFVVCNAENTADGAGVTESIAKELFFNGCDVLTIGDHGFDRRKDIEEYIKKEPRVVRLANYPKGVPGSGSCLVECKGYKIGVVHVAGQVFMRYSFSSPFHAADEEIAKLKTAGAKIILVDMHAEATSEKVALSWYLDGRVSAVVGTHTHIPTADERVSENGTACITDLGMTGPYDSVIGRDKTSVIQKFLTQMNVRHAVATKDVRFSGVIIQVDEYSGKAISIERVHRKLQ